MFYILSFIHVNVFDLYSEMLAELALYCATGIKNLKHFENH